MASTQDYLSLQLVRLKRGEQWAPAERGVSFIFVRGGSGTYNGRTASFQLWPGDVLVQEGAGEALLSVGDGPELLFLHFTATLEHLFPLFDCEEICRLRNLGKSFQQAKLYRASSRVAIECQRLLSEVPARSGVDHRAQLLRVVTAILAVEFKSLPRAQEGYVPVEQHMNQVFEELSVAELLRLSVSELAARFGCSRRHLNRLFHQHFGFSVSALRMEIRLLKAMSLLRDRSSKVITVAEQCGFNHLGLFNTCFKRRFNVSPGQWRKTAVKAVGPLSGEDSAESHCRIRGLGLCPWSNAHGALGKRPGDSRSGSPAGLAVPPREPGAPGGAEWPYTYAVEGGVLKLRMRQSE